MSYSLTWLPEVLEKAGLKVAEVPGWRERGRGEMGQVLGVICHYTAGPRQGNMGSLDILIRGRPDLSGPLCQLGLGRDGTYYIVAAGRANHAGKGVWKGVTNGNSNFIGIEAENSGRGDDPWPEVQLEAYRRGVAAIFKHLGRDAAFCCGHREYALPAGRKSDPNLAMDDFRERVAQLILSDEPAPLIPGRERPRSGRATLRRGDRGELVGKLQKALGVEGPDLFGPKTEAAVRRFQRERGLLADGIVGPKTWVAIDGAEPPASPVADEGTPPDHVAGVVAAGRPLAWGGKVQSDFREKVIRIAAGIGCEPDALMACMAFETGETFDPAVRNRHSGATGLIQFMPSTAAWLGTTIPALAAMTPVDQLDYVERYFRRWSRVQTIEDVYMAILWPKAIGKPDSYVLFSKPAVTYKQNKGLDADGDGHVTKWEAAAKVRQALARGLAGGNVG